MKKKKKAEPDKDLLELERTATPNVCVCVCYMQFLCELPHKQSLICAWYEELAQCAVGEFAFGGLFIRRVYFFH